MGIKRCTSRSKRRVYSGKQGKKISNYIQRGLKGAKKGNYCKKN